MQFASFDLLLCCNRSFSLITHPINMFVLKMKFNNSRFSACRHGLVWFYRCYRWQIISIFGHFFIQNHNFGQILSNHWVVTTPQDDISLKTWEISMPVFKHGENFVGWGPPTRTSTQNLKTEFSVARKTIRV